MFKFTFPGDDIRSKTPSMSVFVGFAVISIIGEDKELVMSN